VYGVSRPFSEGARGRVRGRVHAREVRLVRAVRAGIGGRVVVVGRVPSLRARGRKKVPLEVK
jgi:hypothetical protein